MDVTQTPGRIAQPEIAGIPTLAWNGIYQRTAHPWFATVIEALPKGLCVMDRRGLILYANPRFCALFGCSSDSMVGLSMSELFDDPVSLRRYIDGCGPGLFGPLETSLTRDDGQTLVVRVSPSPLFDDDGRRSGSLAFLEDVTPKHTAEVPSAFSEGIFRTLLEALPTGVCVVQNTRLIYLNPRFAEIFGYAREELLGTEFLNLIHPEDRPTLDHSVEKGTARVDVGETAKIRGLKNGGELIHLRSGWRSIELRGKSARLGSLSDITAEKHAELLLQATSTELRMLSEQLLTVQEQERRRLAAELHDSIGQYLSALKFGLQDIEPRNCVADAAAGRLPPCASLVPVLQEVIEEVRRLSSNLRPPLLDDLGILATVNWFLRRLEDIFPTLHITNEIAVQEADIPDPLKIVIFRILQESLNNVIKHASATRVQVKLARIEDRIELVIDDDGVGFDVAAALETEPRDRGFGLIGMRERISLSGGLFQIQSRPGEGTRVLATWPPAGN